jgi:hypothetical protein
MASEVQIVNRALRLLKVAPITAIGQDSEAGEWADGVYTSARDALLAEYPWNFAMKRAALSASPDAPAWGYGYAYPLPADCLRVLSIEGEPDESTEAWVVEAGSILTDAIAPLYIRYIEQVTNPGRFPPMFTEALVARLAAEGAYGFTGNVAREQLMNELYQARLAIAKRYDAQEGTPEPGPVADDWLRERV